MKLLKITEAGYQPRTVHRTTQEMKDIARYYLLKVEEDLRSDMDPKWLRGRIASLLIHFYKDDLPTAAQDRIAQDWVNVLCNFRKSDIEQAVKDHLSNTRRKPVPFDIRELALKAASKDIAIRHQCRAILAAPEAIIKSEVLKESKAEKEQREKIERRKATELKKEREASKKRVADIMKEVKLNIAMNNKGGI